MNVREKERRGFTLIELMVVIVIIMVLMAMLVPATIKFRRNAAEKKVLSALVDLRSGIDGYYTIYRKWPVSGDQPTERTAYSSSEIIQELRRASGLKTTPSPLWTKAEKKIVNLEEKEFQVVINPEGRTAIKSDSIGDLYDSGYTISFRVP